ncbi:MAG: DUF1054 domain-containing protein [Candidatus Sericytochromatia bacterium]|nr:DUF1054 domain-containing protein [Candidatus Sericytochromatia bacterium]
MHGFSPADFDVFTIPGFEPRMTALKERIRPRLTEIGVAMTPKLADMIGQPVFPHVARHARRTVNPPEDTWVAFSTSARGYKALPHFQVGLWNTYLFIRYCAIYESPNKAVVARNLLANPKVAKQLPKDFTWSWDHCRPETATLGSMKAAGWQLGLERAIRIQKGEVLCGLDVQRDNTILADGDTLLATIEQTFATLTPLYRMSFE